MTTSESLSIEYLERSTLRAFERNARTHSKKQLKQIADSIRTFGFTNPILVDDDLTILAGHGRVEAAKLLNMVRVPCVKLSKMTRAQKRAYVIADNKIALNAGWDEEILLDELQALQQIDADFDVELTGFSTAEIDNLVSVVHAERGGDSRDETLPPIDPACTIAMPGDLWCLGGHRVFCGDSTVPDSFSVLMGSEKADMVFTDPPYNVPIDGHVSGLGRIKHREFAMAAGEMTSAEFTQFLQSTFRNLHSHTTNGSIHFVCMDWRHMEEVLRAAAGIYADLKNLCVWVKDNGGMGTFYRSQHELVFAFKSGHEAHVNNFELGQHGRYRTNVWSYRGLNSRNKICDKDMTLHPTVKPVAMIADAIRDVSKRGGVVLDCFGGSGSTLIAAHKTSRRARILELDPVYVDLIIRRWQAYAKDDAILERTGNTFGEVAKRKNEGALS